MRKKGSGGASNAHPLPICPGPHPATLSKPTTCFLLPDSLLDFSCPLFAAPFPGLMGPSLCLSAEQVPQALCFLAGHYGGGMGNVCTEEASPNLSLPLVPGTFSMHHHLPQAVLITSTSGELATGCLRLGGDLHVSTNIYAHPEPSASAFLGWPFTPGPETGQR